MTKNLLVTGAAGYVAHHIVPELARRYRLRLMDIRTIDPEMPGEHLIADICNPDDINAACHEIDTVVHLAAEPSLHAGFDDLLGPNLVGLYNVYEAAFRANCRRVVFASSINTVMAYPAGSPVTPDMPVNPANLYGAAKCFGEAVARHYANHGLSSICVRIGQIREMDDSFENTPGEKYDGAWISTRDLAQLFARCVDANDVNFAIAHGQSLHARPRMSIESTCELLSYRPEDDTR